MHSNPMRKLVSFVYEIHVEGHLDDSWSFWFDGLEMICLENGQTRLVGEVRDQAALFGLLRRIRDSGMPLLSVVRKEEVSNTIGADASVG